MEVAFDDDPVKRHAQGHPAPGVLGLRVRIKLDAVGLLLALDPPAFRGLEPLALVGTDLLGLGLKRVDLFLGDLPQLEVVDGPVDGIAVSLYGTFGTENKDRRHRFLVFFGVVENMLVELQLHQCIQKIVLLGSDVQTVKDPEQIALGDGVALP